MAVTVISLPINMICINNLRWSISSRSGDGICCEWGEGQYNITTNGQLVVEGGEFGKSEGTLFSLPFSSNGMTEEDKMWLTSHNSRRKKWHEEAGVEYKALKWSYALSDESKVWAEKLLDENCESLVLYHGEIQYHILCYILLTFMYKVCCLPFCCISTRP